MNTRTMIACLTACCISAFSMQSFAQSVPQTVHELPPSNGNGAFIAGGIFTGIGASDILAGSLLYYSAMQTPQGSNNKTGIIVAASGGGELLIGLICLVVGASQRSDYNHWKFNHNILAGISPTGYHFSW